MKRDNIPVLLSHPFASSPLARPSSFFPLPPLHLCSRAPVLAHRVRSFAFGSGRVAESLVFGHETAFWHDVACALFDRRSATWGFSERGSSSAPETDEKRRFACQNAVSWPFSGRFRARARRPARRAQLIRPARPTRLARPTRSAHLIWPAYPTSKNRPSRAPRLLARKKQRAPALPGPAKTQSTTRAAAPQRYASAYSSLSFTRCS